MYFCKLFEDTLPLVDEYQDEGGLRGVQRGSHFYRQGGSGTSSLSESSDDGAVKGYNFFS